MPSAIDVKVLGAKEVLKSLEGVKDALRKRITRKALYQGAVIIRDEARRLAPVRTGALKGAIVARTDKDPDVPGEYAGYVSIANKPMVLTDAGKLVSSKSAAKRGTKGQKLNPRRYAHLVEYGTQPHAVGKSDVLERPGKKAKTVQKGTLHPGARAKPFLRPAVEAKREEAFRAIHDSLVREVVTEAAKQLGAQ